MTSTRRVCIALLVLATFTAAFAANICNIDHCTSCLEGNCTWCEAGYRASGGQCAPCATANCRFCAITGICIMCNDGYQLHYIVRDETGPTISKYGSCVANNTVSPPCSVPHCTSCVNSTCLYCENGYYAQNGQCTSCATAHCAHCEIAGHCISCEAGYRLNYVNSSNDGITISRWGTCSNGATFANAYVALVSVAVVAIAAFAA